MVSIYFVRHGEYGNNLSGKMNNDPSKQVPLTKKGIEQAKEAGKKLAEVCIGVAISSEFERCLETAKHIIDLEPKVDIRLDEIRISPDGADYEENRIRIDSQILDGVILEGDESLIERQEALKELLENLKKSSYDHILAVTHKDVIRLIRLIVNNLPIDDFYKFAPGNCEIYKVDL